MKNLTQLSSLCSLPDHYRIPASWNSLVCLLLTVVMTLTSPVPLAHAQPIGGALGSGMTMPPYVPFGGSPGFNAEYPVSFPVFYQSITPMRRLVPAVRPLPIQPPYPPEVNRGIGRAKADMIKRLQLDASQHALVSVSVEPWVSEECGIGIQWVYGQSHNASVFLPSSRLQARQSLLGDGVPRWQIVLGYRGMMQTDSVPPHYTEYEFSYALSDTGQVWLSSKTQRYMGGVYVDGVEIAQVEGERQEFFDRLGKTIRRIERAFAYEGDLRTSMTEKHYDASETLVKVVQTTYIYMVIATLNVLKEEERVVTSGSDKVLSRVKIEYAYDSNGKLVSSTTTTRHFDDVTGALESRMVEQDTYDGQGRLTERTVEQFGADNTLLSRVQQTIVRGDSGTTLTERVSWFGDGGALGGYTDRVVKYDTQGRITEESEQTYAQGRLVSSSIVRQTFDAAGRVTSVYRESTSQYFGFFYPMELQFFTTDDAFYAAHPPVSPWMPFRPIFGDLTTEETTSYRYNEKGLLVHRQLEGRSYDNTGRTHSRWQETTRYAYRENGTLKEVEQRAERYQDGRLMERTHRVEAYNQHGRIVSVVEKVWRRHSYYWFDGPYLQRESEGVTGAMPIWWPGYRIEQIERQITYSYDESGRLTRFVTVERVMDQRNRLLSKVHTDITYTYAADGTRTAVIKRETTYYVHGEVIGRNVLTEQYRGDRLVEQVTEEFGANDKLAWKMVNRWQYDDQGQLTRFVSKHFTYGGNGQVTSRTEITDVYDTAGRLVRHQWKQFNGQGELVSHRETVYAYDTAGHMISQEVAQIDANDIRTVQWRTEWAYDEDGRIVSYKFYTRLNGELTLIYDQTNTYNAQGRLLVQRTISLRSGVVASEYRYAYDDAGRKTIEECWDLGDPDDPADDVRLWGSTMEYDAAGRLIKQTRVRGDGGVESASTWQYDDAGRLIKRTTSWLATGGSSESGEQFTYDTSGVLRQKLATYHSHSLIGHFSSSKVTEEYDEQGVLTRRTDLWAQGGEGGVTAWRTTTLYNARGLATSVVSEVWAGGLDDWDGDGHNSGWRKTGETISEYDDSGLLSRVEEKSYDEDGELSSERVTTYTRNAQGVLTQETRVIKTYNNAGQLVGRDKVVIEYDGYGRATSVEGKSWDAQGRQKSWSKTERTYHDDGAVKQEVSTVGRFNANGQYLGKTVTTIRYSPSGEIIGQEVKEYDAEGREIERSDKRRASDQRGDKAAKDAQPTLNVNPMPAGEGGREISGGKVPLGATDGTATSGGESPQPKKPAMTSGRMDAVMGLVEQKQKVQEQLHQAPPKGVGWIEPSEGARAKVRSK